MKLKNNITLIEDVKNNKFMVDYNLLKIAFLCLIPLILFYAYLASRTKKIPSFVREFLNNVNFDKSGKLFEEITKFSIFFKVNKIENLNYFYRGKVGGAENYFASFRFDGRPFYLFGIKKEVSQLVVTNFLNTDNGILPLRENIRLGDKEYLVWTKEKYVLENVIKSRDFRFEAQELFKGKNIWLEFTDLNQIFFITDNVFTKSPQLIETMTLLNKIKENI